MCGRFIVSYTYDELVKMLDSGFDLFEGEFTHEERYNVAPSEDVLSIIATKNKYKVGYIKWGFVPYFAKDISSSFSMINARSETIEQKPAFKQSFQKRRSVVIANGFYEWQRRVDKTPYLFQYESNELFYMAAIWDVNKNVSSTPLFTTSILTKEADEVIGDIHDRMPVILNAEEAKIYLSSTDINEVHQLIDHASMRGMIRKRVSAHVNNVRNKDKSCIEEV